MPMAMSDTGSSLAPWSELCHYASSPGLSVCRADAGATTDSTIVSSDAAAVTSPTSAGSAGGGSPSRNLTGIEGPRVAKPSSARKRSRASRRAPVTLLNTDTANFRAMVQQFTGIPAPSPFAGPAGGGGLPVINFAADYAFPPPAGVMSFDHLHHQRQQQTFQDQLLRPQQHQHQQQYTGAPFGYGNLQALAGGGYGDVFAHGLGLAEDRMLLQSMQAAQMPGSAANNSANGYFA